MEIGRFISIRPQYLDLMYIAGTRLYEPIYVTKSNIKFGVS